MRRLYILVGIALLVSSLYPAMGQQPQATPPPIPRPPFLKRAPDSSQWLVSVATGQTDPSRPKDLPVKYDKRMLVTKSGPIRWEITVDGSGTRLSDRWCEGNVQTLLFPGKTDPVVIVQGATLSWNGAAGGFADYTKTDFPGFEWISKKNYVGMQTISGIDCIVFHSDPAGGTGGMALPAASPTADGAPPAAPPIPQTGVTAYIEEDNRMPVLLQIEKETTTYQMRPPPTTPLTVPPNVQAALDAIKARVQLASRPQAAP